MSGTNGIAIRAVVTTYGQEGPSAHLPHSYIVGRYGDMWRGVIWICLLVIKALLHEDGAGRGGGLWPIMTILLLGGTDCLLAGPPRLFLCLRAKRLNRDG